MVQYRISFEVKFQPNLIQIYDKCWLRNNPSKLEVVCYLKTLWRSNQYESKEWEVLRGGIVCILSWRWRIPFIDLGAEPLERYWEVPTAYGVSLMSICRVRYLLFEVLWNGVFWASRPAAITYWIVYKVVEQDPAMFGPLCFWASYIENFEPWINPEHI